MASMAAFLTLSGVSKSGSPAPNPITSRPFAFRSRAFWLTAMVAEGFTRERASARKAILRLHWSWEKYRASHVRSRRKPQGSIGRIASILADILTGGKSFAATIARETRGQTPRKTLSRSVGLAHIIRQEDGTSTG